jgi:hypothetical protein
LCKEIPGAFWGRNAGLEAGMGAIALMSVLCTAGVAFYVRFLVALWKESKHRWICYLVRLEPDANEYLISEPREVKTSFSQAA